MGAHARIAVGAVQPSGDVTALVWALAELLLRRGRSVQCFSAASCFGPLDRVASLTGQRPRHLDSWLMNPDVCRDLFLRGARTCDWALVAGRFEPGGNLQSTCSSLDTLCAWLDLPRVVVVDAHQLDVCCLPERPSGVEAVLLDRVANAPAARRLQTTIESLWGVSVLGALGPRDDLSDELHRPPAGAAARQLAGKLVQRMVVEPDVQGLLALASRRQLAAPNEPIVDSSSAAAGLRVAVAFDAAFNCYFADTLDALALAGATVCDFSPLRHDRLPADCQIVYFGCGHPEEFGPELVANACLAASLREHVRRGGRLYAEGGGLAYLCRQLTTTDGVCLPMAGVLPLVAHATPPAAQPQPVEIQLAADTWLGPAGGTLRGYDNDRWRIEPAGPIACPARSADGRVDWLFGSQRAIGSRLHLNFAAQPDVLRAMVHMSRPAAISAAARPAMGR